MQSAHFETQHASLLSSLLVSLPVMSLLPEKGLVLKHPLPISPALWSSLSPRKVESVVFCSVFQMHFKLTFTKSFELGFLPPHLPPIEDSVFPKDMAW